MISNTENHTDTQCSYLQSNINEDQSLNITLTYKFETQLSEVQ